MIHARKDYNRFQDPENKIGKDEPVILFRAQDKHFIEVLYNYIKLVESDPDHSVAIPIALYRHIQGARRWQEIHGSKKPDMDMNDIRY